MEKPKRILSGRRDAHTFRRAVLRGLAVLAPPVLTVVIFLWVGSSIHRYVVAPVTTGLSHGIVLVTGDIRTAGEIPGAQVDPREKRVLIAEDGTRFQRVAGDQYIPESVYDQVESQVSAAQMPVTGHEIYRTYVQLEYMRPFAVYPFIFCLFVAVMYLLGRFMAAGIGRVFWNLIERGIHQLPLVRNVYSSVKQVTDFLFSGTEIEYTRVVAIEYPRKGIWSIGLVTGESMLQIRGAAQQPVLSILIPSSPMPVTGYTITVLKSETVDLDLTIDQAFQFCISCGVVVPPHQMQSPFAPTEVPAADPAVPIAADPSLPQPASE